MKIEMDQILDFWVDSIKGNVRIPNEPTVSTRRVQLAILHEFERVGYARRRLGHGGGIRWECTKSMRSYLRDCELDARDDLDVL
jgi:hypothetical protein